VRPLRRSPRPRPIGSPDGGGVRVRHIVAFATIAVLAVALSPIGADAAAGLSRVVIADPSTTSQQAHVDAAGNLQVGGTVSIAGSPTVGASQSGAWNVGLTGTPSVQLSGTPAVKLDPSQNEVTVGDPERRAIEIEKNVLFSGQSGNTLLFTVPSGERLVVTEVSWQIKLPVGSSLLDAELLGSGNAIYWFRPARIGGTSNFDFYADTEATTFTVDQNELLDAEADQSDASTPGAGFSVTISGYLIDCTNALPCS